MVKKKISIVIKKRPFKIWSKNKNYNFYFLNTFQYVPIQLNTYNSVSFNTNIGSLLRYRRVIIKSASYGYISANSIEAFRKCVSPYFRKKQTKIYKFFIRCYSFLPLTKKPSEVRIGGGKGSKVRGFFAPVRPGQILFEIFSRNPIMSKNLIKYSSKKLGISTTIFYF